MKEKLIIPEGSGRLSISNLGGVLFAKNLHDFDSLSRKALRVIEYKGTNRVQAAREEEILQGYAAGFERVLENINRQLPTRKVVTQTLREEQAVYPPIAVRELLANALIHQDFSYTGDGPKVKIFTDRVEFTNPGVPLIETLRFVDEPPRSRNEALARLLRRMRICEERGSGIDRTVSELERHQLPAPDFRRTEHHTVALLFHAFQLNKVSKQDRIRACYYHACLRYVSHDFLTHESFRKRLGLSDEEYPKASRIIRDAIETGRLKPSDPHSKSRKHPKYLPFWA